MEHEALLWQVEGDRVHCLLCPNDCRIAEGRRGVCGVRAVRGMRLKALTYGLVSSVAVDPIEKKPVFHFCPGTQVLSLGSVGCSMRCGHCQNWQISRPKGDDGTVPLRYLDPGEVAELAMRRGCPGVAFTYNEPVIWIEYVLDAGRIAQERGLFVVMVTNGYVTPAGIDAFSKVVDVWRVDIKGFDESTYRTLCNVGHAQAVRDQTIRAKRAHGMHVECVTNVVPTINDSEDELRSVAEWIAGSLGAETPWHITRFHPYLDFSHLPSTPLKTLERARAIGHEAGLRFVYLGNVDVAGGEDTVCPACGTLAVRRQGFSVVAESLDTTGACASCGADLNIRVSGCSERTHG